MSNKKNYLKYLSAVLLFGSNGIIAARIDLPSFEIVFFRTLIGSVFLILLFLISRQKLSSLNCRKDLLLITLSGACMGVSWIFLFEAYAHVGVSLATLLYYCGPIIVMVLSPVFFGERLTAGKIIGLGAVAAGILFVNGISAGAIDMTGMLCGLLAAVSYAAMVILNKKSSRLKGLDNSLIQLVSSFVIVAAVTGVKTGFHIAVSPDDWVWIMILGLVNTGVGCWFYFSSMGHLPVQTVAICGYLEPLSAVLLSAALLGEVLLPLQILGAVLIIGGTMFGEFCRPGIRSAGHNAKESDNAKESGGVKDSRSVKESLSVKEPR